MSERQWSHEDCVSKDRRIRKCLSITLPIAMQSLQAAWFPCLNAFKNAIMIMQPNLRRVSKNER